MTKLTKPTSSGSILRKIVAAFVFTVIAIFLAYTITRYAFQDMLDTVEDLSAPNEKLSALHHVFEEITKLDHLHRAEAIKNPDKPFKDFLNQSKISLAMIDSLAMLNWHPDQQARIDSMKDILRKRDELFFAYLKMKSNLLRNKSLTKRIDTLSTIIEKQKLEIDTSVISTEKKTTTTYVRDTVEQRKDDRAFFSRLFNKKKKRITEDTVRIRVQEELNVRIDTVAIAKQNKALEEVEKIVYDLEADQRLQSIQLINQEMELIHTSNLFMNELLGMLHEVEREELESIQLQSDQANTLVTQSISRIGLLLIVFFLVMALLVFLIWIDVSKSNYYKLQLEKAKDEALELSQIKQRFLANMSHEIRTPLQSIIGFAEQLRYKKANDPEAVDAIYSSSEHLLHIVNEVLDYSRISSGNFTLASESFRLMDVVKEVESAMRIQAMRKGLTLLVDTEQATDHFVLGDSFRLRQVLYNVMGNAIKFTTKGFVKLTLKTTDDDRDVQCHFEVKDSGIGIRKEDLNRIFNQFEQADVSITRNFGGTGLGLTIVKSLIEAQGGNLRVTSEPGQGSTFSIHLQFRKDYDVHPEKQQDKKLLPASAFTGKVILVDDDPLILKLCALIMENNTIDHTIYNDAEKLLRAPADASVTHIFMDIRMPNINGMDLCSALRKQYPPTTKFIALTAHVFEQERKSLIDHGFDIVLSKPFHEEELLEVLGVAPLSRTAATEALDEEDQELRIDLSALRQMTFNDDLLFQSVLQQFIDETRSDLRLLEEKINQMEQAPIREIVHKLAGRTGQMGMLQLSLKLRNIETKMETGKNVSALLENILETKEEVKLVLEKVAMKQWS